MKNSDRTTDNSRAVSHILPHDDDLTTLAVH
jgi:hypothetical protein